MKLRLLPYYDDITNSFWFIPTVMALLAAIAAWLTLSLDRGLASELVNALPVIWSGNADGARGLLATVVGSVMTVVSIVFSITITVLAQTSAHYGPRILRNFTADRGNQITLGTFIATFVYCLLVLRTIRGIDGSTFIPDISVTIGVLLTMTSLAVLIYFIHHISQSIQAENLIAGAGREFQHVLQVMFPEDMGHGAAQAIHDPDQIERYRSIDWSAAPGIVTHRQGYVQLVDTARLMQTVYKHDLMVRLAYRPGDFVVRQARLMQAWPATRMNREIERQLEACYSFGNSRSTQQDVGYPLQQLVEIALRALSPGINEPFTAMTCIDWLGASLGEVLGHRAPSPYRYDKSGVLRVVAYPLSFKEIAALAFHPIRRNSSRQVEVMAYLLHTIGRLATRLHRKSEQQILLHHVELIHADAQQLTNEADLAKVEQAYQQAHRALTSMENLVDEQDT